MVTVHYGKEHKEVIILLHGGGLSWWNFREVAEQLQDKYHVILPVLDGHAGSDRDFTTIEDNAKEIIKYIDENYNGSVELIGGVSLGGQILAEMLAQRKDICNYAFVESALVLPMKLTHMLVKPMMDMSFGLIRKKWFSKLQFRSLHLKSELFEEYYRDTSKLTKENMISFLQENSRYSLKEELGNTSAKVYVFAGEKEIAKIKKSAALLHKRIPNSERMVMKKYHHGEFAINDPSEYAKQIIRVLE